MTRADLVAMAFSAVAFGVMLYDRRAVMGWGSGKYKRKKRGRG